MIKIEEFEFTNWFENRDLDDKVRQELSYRVETIIERMTKQFTLKLRSEMSKYSLIQQYVILNTGLQSEVQDDERFIEWAYIFYFNEKCLEDIDTKVSLMDSAQRQYERVSEFLSNPTDTKS